MYSKEELAARFGINPDWIKDIEYEVVDGVPTYRVTCLPPVEKFNVTLNVTDDIRIESNNSQDPPAL